MAAVFTSENMDMYEKGCPGEYEDFEGLRSPATSWRNHVPRPSGRAGFSKRLDWPPKMIGFLFLLRDLLKSGFNAGWSVGRAVPAPDPSAICFQ